jgi:hypothetical protein
MIIWAYGSATGPWAYLAQKDQQGGGNVFSTIGVFFAEVAFIATGLLAILRSPPFPNLILIFSLIMAGGLILQTIIGIVEQMHSRDRDFSG